VGQENLEGDISVHIGLVGLINRGHPTLTDDGDDFIGAEMFSDEMTHGFTLKKNGFMGCQGAARSFRHRRSPSCLDMFLYMISWRSCAAG